MPRRDNVDGANAITSPASEPTQLDTATQAKVLVARKQLITHFLKTIASFEDGIRTVTAEAQRTEATIRKVEQDYVYNAEASLGAREEAAGFQVYYQARLDDQREDLEDWATGLAGAKMELEQLEAELDETTVTVEVEAAALREEAKEAVASVDKNGDRTTTGTAPIQRDPAVINSLIASHRKAVKKHMADLDEDITDTKKMLNSVKSALEAVENGTDGPDNIWMDALRHADENGTGSIRRAKYRANIGGMEEKVMLSKKQRAEFVAMMKAVNDEDGLEGPN